MTQKEIEEIREKARVSTKAFRKALHPQPPVKKEEEVEE